jgi:hypothetical protein
MARRYLVGFGFVAAVLAAAYFGALVAGTRAVNAADKPEVKVKPMPPLRAGFVAMADVMKGSKKWQEMAQEASRKREKIAQKLGVQRAELVELQQKTQKAVGEDQIKLAAELRDAGRKFEDAERDAVVAVDKESLASLVELQAEFAREVEALARERQLDVVYAHPMHPDKMFASMGKTTQTMDLYFRPNGTQPLYMRADVDLTGDLLARLNRVAAKKETE